MRILPRRLRLAVLSGWAVALCLSFARLAAAAEDEKGMPQLNPHWWPSQLLWLAISFVLLYVLMSRLALPRIARVQAARHSHIEQDLATARKARDELAAMMTSYEATTADARTRAQALLAEATKETSALASKSTAELAAIVTDRISQAERRIGTARAQVLSSLAQTAGDVAAAIVGHVVKLEVDAPSAEAAVRRVLAARKG